MARPININVHEFREFFKNRRNLYTVIILIILALALPFIIRLAQQTQIFKSRASNPPVSFTGQNVDNKGEIPILKPTKKDPNCKTFCELIYQVDIQLDPVIASPQP